MRACTCTCGVTSLRLRLGEATRVLIWRGQQAVAARAPAGGRVRGWVKVARTWCRSGCEAPPPLVARCAAAAGCNL